jgi:hypothetical protein
MPEIPYEKVIYDPIKLAYLAGIIDGEGSICAYKTYPAGYNRYVNPSYRCVLSICNTRKELLDWIDENFSNLNSGQKKYERTIFKKNCRKDAKIKKYIYEWVVQGHRLADVLTQVFPYLVLKKRQAELAIEFRSTFGKERSFGKDKLLDPAIIQKREEILNELHKLNSKGFLRDSIESSEST